MNLELENNPTNTSLNEIADPAVSQVEQDLQQGLTFCAEQRWAEAKACFEAVIAEDPAHKIAWNNLGNVLDDVGDVAGAYQAFERALALDPDYESPKKNLAIVAYKEGDKLYAAGNLQGALEAFQTAARQGQNLADYDHSYLQLLLETCEHMHVTEHAAHMRERTLVDENYYPHPYPLLAVADDPAWHMLAAKRHVARLCKDAGIKITRPAASFVPSKRARIRVAYLSCDWHQHPVPQQLLASIEAHDRTKFEVFGIATDGLNDTTAWRQRIERAFEQFLTLGHLSDTQIAEQLRSLEVDIAIDLSQYMQGGRPLILATRPCPVQIAFLGYAGTSGAPWIDYLIADEVTIPKNLEQFYSEKIIRLPNSFMPDNDQRPPVRVPVNRAAERIQQGLPENAFVFCAFNNPYKITPSLLMCWFRLLSALPSSVLWLQANNDVTKRHIEAAALAAGVDTKRVIFAERTDSFDAHLQRYQLADLFLDTCPYNAHVTAADALWAGLPVLTLQGESFASRVASSILTALDLSELVTTNLASYEARALELARDAGQLKALRAKLGKNKADGKYFNQTLYVRGLENAFTAASHIVSKKLITFSLWGDNSVYLIGALRNAQLAAKLYPDWVCRFYCANDLAQEFLNQLQSYSNVEIVLMPPKPDRGGAFWRFLATEDVGVSHILFRDTDSRISSREVAAVNEWLSSGKPFHLMRDHPFHWTPIMAGMWGCRGGAIEGMQERLSVHEPAIEYGSDQQFLADVVYPQIKNHCVIHDSIGISDAGLDVRLFPTARTGLEFVGQCYDQNDQPNTYYEQELANALHSL